MAGEAGQDRGGIQHDGRQQWRGGVAAQARAHHRHHWPGRLVSRRVPPLQGERTGAPARAPRCWAHARARRAGQQFAPARRAAALPCVFTRGGRAPRAPRLTPCARAGPRAPWRAHDQRSRAARARAPTRTYARTLDLRVQNYEVHGIIRRSSSFNTGRVEHIYQDPHLPHTQLFLHHGDLTDSTNLFSIISKVKPHEVRAEPAPRRPPRRTPGRARALISAPRVSMAARAAARGGSVPRIWGTSEVAAKLRVQNQARTRAARTRAHRAAPRGTMPRGMATAVTGIQSGRPVPRQGLLRNVRVHCRR